MALEALPSLQHYMELAVAAASGFGGAWARERYRKPKGAATEPLATRKEMSDLSVRVSAIEQRTAVNEWDIRQSKTDVNGLAATLREVVAGMQEVQVTLARIEERLEDRS